MGPRFVYEGGPSENPFSETEGSKIEAAKKAETVSEYDQSADKTYYDGIIKGIVDAKKAELEGKIDADIKNIKEDEEDKEKKKATLEALKKDIPTKIAEYQKELETARDASLGKIKSAVEARNTEIKEEANKYREAFVLEMESHDVEQRRNHPNKEDEGNWENVKAQIHKNFQFHNTSELIRDGHIAEGMQMQQHDKEGNPAGEPTNWNRSMQLEFMTEMIQTIYEEQGKEAADAKVAEIKKKRFENGGDKNQVNWFVYDASFQGGEKSNVKDMSMFKHVAQRMGAPVDKPKVVGHVLGMMASADKYFSEKHNAPEAFKAYQDYVQKQLNDPDAVAKMNSGEELLSPSQWLQKNGDKANLKEVLAGQEKNRDKFIDNLMASFNLNEAEGKQRFRLIRAAVDGALWASDDPTDWDKLARHTIAKMMGGKLDFDKLNYKDIDTDRLISKYSKELNSDAVRALGDTGLIYVAGLLEGARKQYATKDPEFFRKYKKFVEGEIAFDGSLMKKIRRELEFAGGETGLHNSPKHQENIRELLDKGIRAAYNYKSDLEKAQKKQEQKEEEKKPKVDEQLEKAKADTSKVLLVMTDHTASRTSPTQYRQAVSMKAAYEKAEDKKAWLESNKEELDSLKKRMPKVLGWEKGLGIERKDSGEVEKDPTNAKPSQAPAGQPSGAPKEGGGDKGLEAFGKESIDVAKAEAAEKGDPLKKEEVPKKVQDKVKDQDPGFYSVTYKEDGAEKKVLVEVKKEEDKKKEDFFAPKKTA